MGFQLVAAGVRGVRVYLVVFNSEVGVEFDSENELRTWLWSPKRVVGTPAEAPLPEIEIAPDFNLLAQRISAADVETASESPVSGAPSPGPGAASGGQGPIAPPPLALPASLVATIAPSGRTFYRFSAFNPDRRVNPVSGDFAPGTYATTDHDKPEVPSGLAAVGRYALPQTASAIYVYECAPKAGTVIHVGTVAPAYGQAGGGVEALFPAGATNNTAPVKVPSGSLPPD